MGSLQALSENSGGWSHQPGWGEKRLVGIVWSNSPAQVRSLKGGSSEPCPEDFWVSVKMGICALRSICLPHENAQKCLILLKPKLISTRNKSHRSQIGSHIRENEASLKILHDQGGHSFLPWQQSFLSLLMRETNPLSLFSAFYLFCLSKHPRFASGTGPLKGITEMEGALYQDIK